MHLTNIWHLLRSPEAPNAYYHDTCYKATVGDVAILLSELHLPDAQQFVCAGCMGLLAEEPHTRESAKIPQP